ncbi:NPCBM/NEW2 domain-containing protein [Microbacterium sp. KNMS]
MAIASLTLALAPAPAIAAATPSTTVAIESVLSTAAAPDGEQAATFATKLTAGVSHSPVDAGRATNVKAVLTTSGGKALANQQVQIQQREVGASTWRTAATVSTNYKGLATLRVGQLQRNREFRAVYTGTSRYGASTSNTTVVKVKPIVKITAVSTLTPTVGQKMTFTGRTSPGLVGKTVALQTYTNGAWRQVATTKVPSSRTFYIPATARDVGSRSYRVVAGPTANTEQAYSNTQKVTVFGWFNLSGIEPVSEDRWNDEDPYTVAGKSMPESVGTEVWWGDPAPASRFGHADYNLSYRCIRFEAFLGLDDSSESGARRPFSARVDSTNYNFGSVGIGSLQRVAIKTNGAFRLHLEYGADTGSEADSLAVFGNARVLCSGQP